MVHCSTKNGKKLVLQTAFGYKKGKGPLRSVNALAKTNALTTTSETQTGSALSSAESIAEHNEDVKNASRGAGLVNVSESEAGEIVSKLIGREGLPDGCAKNGTLFNDEDRVDFIRRRIFDVEDARITGREASRIIQHTIPNAILWEYTGPYGRSNRSGKGRVGRRGNVWHSFGNTGELQNRKGIRSKTEENDGLT